MKVLKHQQWHLFSVATLLIAVYYILGTDDGFLQGTLYGLSTYQWLFLAILIPILHQVYVLICWRMELHYKGLSKVLGNKAFQIFRVGFAALFVSRLITIICLAGSNSGTLEINRSLASLFSLLFLIPAIYLFYSVKKYFGMDRAFGLDHFKQDAFRNKPFVKEGIFKYSSNGM